jgi:hypothetical protein
MAPPIAWIDMKDDANADLASDRASSQENYIFRVEVVRYRGQVMGSRGAMTTGWP